MEELKLDITIETKNELIKQSTGERLLHYIDDLYINEEKELIKKCIVFMRTNDKMGKSVEDLYIEFINQ